ncbi:hypothetical protein DVH24_022853 [Malus domestica]|uniref:superoxide dismutase n=1 Tax=Malus domestica TaxID=3750 RepID=A0A498KKM0_MALDO|nr:hypothetical protein DVH24_022853 [Malus domestica]
MGARRTWQHGGGGEPRHGNLGCAVDTNFGSFETLVQKINAEGAALQVLDGIFLILQHLFHVIQLDASIDIQPVHMLRLALDKELKKLVPANQTSTFYRSSPFHLRNKKHPLHASIRYGFDEDFFNTPQSFPAFMRRFRRRSASMLYKNVRPDYLKNIWKVINWKVMDGATLSSEGADAPTQLWVNYIVAPQV